MKRYQVVLAMDGAEACAVARADRPDLILMDLHLPVLDGLEATRQLKAAPETASIPIIALTADAIAGDREKALEGGRDDDETKPIEWPHLLEKIQTLLQRQTGS